MAHPLSKKNTKEKPWAIIGGVIIILTFILSIKFSRNLIATNPQTINNAKSYFIDSVSTSTPYSYNSVNILSGNLPQSQTNTHTQSNYTNLPIPQISNNKFNTNGSEGNTSFSNLIKIQPHEQEINLPNFVNIINQTQSRFSKIISFQTSPEEKLISNFINYNKLGLATSTFVGEQALPSNFPDFWVTNIQMPQVNAIAIDNSQRIWIGTNKGLVQFFNNKIIIMNKENGLFPTDFITALTHDGTNLWIGTFEGLYKTTDGINFQKYDTSNGLSHDMIWSLDWDGTVLWIGTQNGFSFLLPNGNFERVDKKVSNNGLADVWIGSIKRFDKYLLVGNDDGLSIWDTSHFAANPNAWRTIDMFTTNLVHNWILSLNVIDNKVYIGTPLGLCILETDVSRLFENLQPVFTIYTKQNGLAGHRVNAIVKHKSDVWVGTNEGLSRIRYGALKNITKESGLLSSEVKTLYSFENYLLVGTSNGLQILNSEMIN